MSKDLTTCLAIALSRDYRVEFSPEYKSDRSVNIKVVVRQPTLNRVEIIEIKAADVFAYGAETMLAEAVYRGTHRLGKRGL